MDCKLPHLFTAINLICFSFFIIVFIYFSRHANLVNNTPILIGTIPLKKYFSKIVEPENVEYKNDDLELIPACVLYSGLGEDFFSNF